MLDGTRVIITRPADQGAETAEAVKRDGGVPLVLPMIRILPPEDTAECDAALHEPGSFHGVVFASTNAVEGFYARAQALGIDMGPWRKVPAFAVGPKTADALGRHGVTAVEIAAHATGAALGAMLGSRDIRGKRFLLPRGSRARDEIAAALAAAGALAIPVVVYRTVGPDAATADAMRSAVMSAERKAILFASPSAVVEWVHLFTQKELQETAAGRIVVAIGQTTAAAAAAHGIHVHAVAAEATDSSMVGALGACLRVPAGN